MRRQKVLIQKQLGPPDVCSVSALKKLVDLQQWFLFFFWLSTSRILVIFPKSTHVAHRAQACAFEMINRILQNTIVRESELLFGFEFRRSLPSTIIVIKECCRRAFLFSLR